MVWGRWSGVDGRRGRRGRFIPHVQNDRIHEGKGKWKNGASDVMGYGAYVICMRLEMVTLSPSGLGLLFLFLGVGADRQHGRKLQRRLSYLGRASHPP